MLYFIHTVYFCCLHLLKHYHLLRLRIISLYTKSLLSNIIYRFEDSYWFSYPRLKYFYYSIFKKREKVSVDFVSAKSIIKTLFHESLLCTRCWSSYSEILWRNKVLGRYLYWHFIHIMSFITWIVFLSLPGFIHFGTQHKSTAMSHGQQILAKRLDYPEVPHMLCFYMWVPLIIIRFIWGYDSTVYLWFNEHSKL